MEAKELRIGNYIHLTKDDFKTVKVYEMDAFDIYKVSESDCADIEPIPLTEQWLIELGFEQYAESSVCKGWFIGENPITNDFLITLTWMKNDDGTLKECFYKNGYFIIKYVHQLQNLYFALTGEELTIKTTSEV